MLRLMLGYGLMVASLLGWLAIPALAWFDLDLTQVAAATTGLLIFAEVAFWLAILLLGRPAWERIKGWFRWRARSG